MYEFIDASIIFFKQYGAVGLFMVSFIESFISPVLPDLLLIPLALAQPEYAIYYAVIATLGSVLGGFVGYYAGNKVGLPALQRIVPAQYIQSIHKWLEQYGVWAIFLAALAPIPYKFTCIAAGAFRVNITVFVIASVLGRAKRFLLEGILIYLYGQQAIELFEKYSNDLFWAGIILVVLVVIGLSLQKFLRRPTDAE